MYKQKMSSRTQKILQAKRRNRKLTETKESNGKPKESNGDTPKDHIESSITKANDLWNDIKRRVKEEPSFVELPDNEKIKVYQETDFKQFYTEFPIVSRYMICMGQFSNKAFKRYLIKCKNVKPDPSKSSEKGYNEDQWVQRQADYIRYLWEAYQKQHYSPSESNNIWQHAYKTLKQEFQDFRELHEDVEKKLKEDEKYNKSELVKEMLKRLANEEQSLDANTTKDLIQKLQEQVDIQRKKKLIQSINNDVETVPPTRVTRGSRKELKQSKS